MRQEDYFKPLYLCGIYNGAETGTEGWGHMAFTCVANGDSYEEVVLTYMSNIKILYPFFDFDFKKKNGRWYCDGRLIEIFRLHEEFLQNVQEPYRIEYEPFPITRM